MTTLSPTVQNLFDRVRKDKTGSRNLYRAERIAGLARQLRACVDRRELSVRKLAKLMETSPSQVQRVLSMGSPSNITVDTVLRAADAMGVEVDFHVRDPLRSSYYVQRSCFPVLREVTCISKDLAEQGDLDRSKRWIAPPAAESSAWGGRYGQAV